MIPEKLSNFSGILIGFLINLLRLSKKSTCTYPISFTSSGYFFSPDSHQPPYSLPDHSNDDY